MIESITDNGIELKAELPLKQWEIDFLNEEYKKRHIEIGMLQDMAKLLTDKIPQKAHDSLKISRLLRKNDEYLETKTNKE